MTAWSDKDKSDLFVHWKYIIKHAKKRNLIFVAVNLSGVRSLEDCKSGKFDCITLKIDQCAQMTVHTWMPNESMFYDNYHTDDIEFPNFHQVNY